MTSSDSSRSPIDRDDDLLNALSQGSDASVDDPAADLLGALASTTDLDYSDEDAIRAAIAAATGTAAAASAAAGHSWLQGALAWIKTHRFLVIGTMIAAALAVALVLAALGGARPGASGTPGGYLPAGTTSTDALITSATPSTSSTASRPSRATRSTASSSTTSAAPLPRAAVPSTQPAPSGTQPPLLKVITPPATTRSVPSASSSPSSEPTAPVTVPRPPAPSASPTDVPVAPPTSPSCPVATHTMSGGKAVFNRRSYKTATLTWHDPFGTGKDVVATYTARQVGTAVTIATSDNFRFTAGTIGGQKSAGLALSLASTGRTSDQQASGGVDVDIALTYGGQPITADDATFVVADIDGPYSGSGSLLWGAERVAVSGGGIGTAHNSSYLAGAGTLSDPWRRSHPSQPDTGELNNSATDGAVTIEQPAGSTSTISYRAAPSRSRSNYEVWLTPPDLTITQQSGC